MELPQSNQPPSPPPPPSSVHPITSPKDGPRSAGPKKSRSHEELVSAPALPQDIVLVSGSLDGAVFSVAKHRTKPWNHCVLIHCHGYRPEGTGLQADLELGNNIAFSRLINEGWIVAMTSYRREGLIVADAMKDVNNLRNFICNEYGFPYMCILEGRSMGGCIATLLAEQENVSSMYQGVLAIGAALLVNEPHPRSRLQHCTKIPLLFLTNVSELGPVQAYVDGCRKNLSDETVLPAIWEVSREGHNWVNEDERYDALNNLCQWIAYGTFISRRQWNNTKLKRPESVAQYDHPKSPLSARGTVRSANVHGSLITDLVVADLEKLGIRPNGKLCIRIEKSGELLQNVTYGFHPFVGVPENTWVCFEDPEGHIMVSMLTFRYKHALRAFALQLGDAVTFLAPPPPPRKPVRVLAAE